MNLIGKWKVKEAINFSPENGMEWKTVDELEALGQDESTIATYRNTLTVFNEGGTMETLMTLPADCTQEMLDELIAEGKEIRDGMAVISKEEWKTEDGINYHNTGVNGEVCGEEVSPWVEITEIGDMIELQFLRYIRAE